MIKLKTLLLLESPLEFLKIVDKKYPLAGEIVDGRTVLDNIDNMSSIDASLYKYKILKGVREVPMSDFTISGKHYSVEGNNTIKKLMIQIEESKTISPLIVVVDKKSPYILEGSHRIDALKNLNAKTFPALVVIDLENI